MYWIVARYAAIFAVCFAFGWTVNGWRVGSALEKLKADYAEERAKLEKAHREKERDLQDKADKLRGQKDAEIKSISNRLADALGRLRERPSRTEGSGTCSAANGSQLSKEDAEFLVREASRADEAVTNLNICIQQYNNLR